MIKKENNIRLIDIDQLSDLHLTFNMIKQHAVIGITGFCLAKGMQIFDFTNHIL